ncbi:hypothetical protein ROP_43100 [Rhodococcus opacus B4]|uniref:Uncharacterized protein n=1 Tax=Rhodococcus opacus (strain B4) TaxID=632772 RepID=C1BA54_RHOOB|nr:hypothetical protein ROP_43100 [Rhodococcus opacus B4]
MCAGVLVIEAFDGRDRDDGVDDLSGVPAHSRISWIKLNDGRVPGCPTAPAATAMRRSISLISPKYRW